MSMLQAVVLGLVQGLTEFVPVSSSGHLVLLPWLLGWRAPGLAFDTVLHLGTLLAVVVYFRRDWWGMIAAWLSGLLRWDWTEPEARLAWLLFFGTIPAAVIGYLLEGFFEELFTRPVWVSLFLVVTAALLVTAERLGRRERSLNELRWPGAVAVGLAQAAAIAPGISRSGTTMAAGFMCGLSRPEAARFSFLLSAPVILGAGLVQVVDLVSAPQLLEQVPALAVGLATATASGYVAIWGLLRFLKRRSLHVFAAYCTWVGLSCLIVSWLR